MSNMLKCPNPTCPYVFDPSQVPVGVVLSCPRCGMQFTLGPPAPAAKTATQSPTAGAPSSPPSATVPTQPTAPSSPQSESTSRTATAERKRERGPDDPQRPGPRSNKVQVFILAGIAAVLMAGTILVIIFKIIYRDSSSSDTVSKLKELNIGVENPPSGWTQDNDKQVKIGSPFRTCLSLSCVHPDGGLRSEEHTSELQSLRHLVCRLLLEKKKKRQR